MQYQLIVKRAALALIAVVLFAVLAPLASADSKNTTADRANPEARVAILDLNNVTDRLRDAGSSIQNRMDAATERVEERTKDADARINAEAEMRVETRMHTRDARIEARTNAGTDVRTRGAERAEEARDASAERFAETAVRLSAKVEARIDAYIERIAKRMHAAIERLDMFAVRIESRIEQLKERGVDTSESERLLEIAVEATADAEIAVNEAVIAARTTLDAELTRKSFQEVKQLFTAAKESLHEALMAYRDVVVSLKVAAGLSAEADASVDSTE